MKTKVARLLKVGDCIVTENGTRLEVLGVTRLKSGGWKGFMFVAYRGGRYYLPIEEEVNTVKTFPKKA